MNTLPPTLGKSQSRSRSIRNEQPGCSREAGVSAQSLTHTGRSEGAPWPGSRGTSGGSTRREPGSPRFRFCPSGGCPPELSSAPRGPLRGSRGHSARARPSCSWPRSGAPTARGRTGSPCIPQPPTKERHRGGQAGAVPAEQPVGFTLKGGDASSEMSSHGLRRDAAQKSRAGRQEGRLPLGCSRPSCRGHVHLPAPSAPEREGRVLSPEVLGGAHPWNRSAGVCRPFPLK